MTSWLYYIARLLNDAKAVERALQQRSVKPLVKRAVNKAIGRNIPWWR